MAAMPEFHLYRDDWKVYQEILDQFCQTNGIAGEARVPALISAIGKEAYGKLRLICHPTAPKDMSYEALCELLLRHFGHPELPIYYQRQLFYSATQSPHLESVKQWYLRLKTWSVKCKFDEAVLEPLMIDRFVIGLVPGPVQSHLFELSLERMRSIDEVVELATAKERETMQARAAKSAMRLFANMNLDDPAMKHEGHPRPSGKRHGHVRFSREHGRHGHGHRHGRHHRHHHHGSDVESGPEFHGPPDHHHHHHHPHHHRGRHFGRPFAAAGPPSVAQPPLWHHTGPDELMPEYFRARCRWMNRPARHVQGQSANSDSDSNNSSSNSDSSSSDTSASSDSEPELRQMCKTMKHQIKHLDKLCRQQKKDLRMSSKRHGHWRHHYHDHHHDHDGTERKERHGKKGGCRRGRKHQEEQPTAAEQLEQVVLTEPELIG